MSGPAITPILGMGRKVIFISIKTPWADAVEKNNVCQF